MAILAPLVPVSGRDEPDTVVSPEMTELDVPAEETVPEDKELVEDPAVVTVPPDMRAIAGFFGYAS